jgi:hypothetical protein
VATSFGNPANSTVVIYLSPLLFFYGYVFYAGCINAWHPSLPVWIKAVLIPPIAIFGFVDICIRFTIGAVLMKDCNYKHGYTFSQLLCYYYNSIGDYRKGVADFFASILNPFNKGHIS